MKKIIRWIAEISGVSEQIESEAYVRAGKNMQQYAHWYTGGIMVNGNKYDISNILYEYPRRCLNEGSPHLYGSQFDVLRQELWDLSDKGESIIVNESKKS